MGWCVSSKTMNRYLDGEMPERAKERVREHLAECERCARAYESLRALEEAIRREAPTAGETPDVAGRVVGELQRRGAFLKARVAAGKRRLLGEGLWSGRMVAALSVAASFLLILGVAMNYVTNRDWTGRTEPVLADAERVLVRLVYVDPAEQAGRLAWAREEARKLSLPQRLAKVRGEAEPGWAGDLAPLETLFTVLAGGQPLPPEMADQLSGGALLERTARLHQNLLPG